MIWDKPIHEQRSIDDWLGDKDTGVPHSMVALIKAVQPLESKKTLLEAVLINSVLLVPEISKGALITIAKLLKAAAPYVDIAMWVEVPKLADTLKNTSVISWTDTSLRKAYCVCDILIVSDIPPPDALDKGIAHDRKEIEHILSERLKLRSPALTIIIGPNHLTLPHVKRHSFIMDALDDVSKT